MGRLLFLWRPLWVYALISLSVFIIQKIGFHPHFLISFLLLYLSIFLVRIEDGHPKHFGMDIRDWHWQDLGLPLKTAVVVLLPYLISHLYFFPRHIQASFFFLDKILSLIFIEMFLVGLPEEVFFRGYLQTRLEDIFIKRFHFWGAEFGWGMILTSALFALSHLLVTGRYFSLTVFFPALVFGWLRIRSGKVLAPAVFHGLSNIIYIILPLNL